MTGGYNSLGGGSPLTALILLASIAALPRLATTYKSEGCVFPSRWAGHWFQSGVIQQITIEGDRLSTKGKCLSSEGDKFVLVDEGGCHKCVVIHEKHINVLQYKETFCHTRDKLPNICALITGDALLYSMFRENSAPVTCPLKGPFSFTYNRGHGECKSPVSSIESCTEESRLLLNYQACHDVYGSESIVEELECLATWKEGSLRYLVGKIHHNHATSNEDRYRCFVYEKMNGIGHSSVKEGEIEYKVAQSGDATCNGLFSAMEGSRTMSLKRVPLAWKCKFPTWLTFPGHWHTLDYTSTYSFHQKNATLRITNQTGADIKVHCAHTKAASPSGNSIALVAHWQHHCVGRFVCLAFHRRGTHVVELQMGKPAIKPEDACSSSKFDPLSAPFVTLVTSNPEPRSCPYSGKFTITGLKILQRSARSLIINDDKNVDVKKITHKHGHRKHKYLDANGNQEEISNVEWQKIKYQKFLEKIFAKEAHKKELRIAKKKLLLLLNDTSILSNKTVDESDIISFDNVTEYVSNRTRRSTKSSSESNTCVNSEYTMLDIGCNTEENMEFHSSCDNKDFLTGYSCHGGWTENGTSFLITTPLTRDSIGAKRYCFIYKETRDKIIQFTRSSAGCERTIRPGVDGSLVFNATNSGECLVTASNAISLKNRLSDCLVINLTIMLIAYYFISR